MTILCPNVPSAAQMAALTKGLAHAETHLHHVEGHPTQISALKAARVHEMHAVIMLAKDKIGKGAGQTALVDDLIHDTDVILGHNLVCGIAKDIQPITELTHSSSVMYLDDNSKPIHDRKALPRDCPYPPPPLLFSLGGDPYDHLVAPGVPNALDPLEP